MTEASNWKNEIERLEMELCRAFLERDIESLSAILSDQFIVNSPINRILEKASVLDLLRAGTIARTRCMKPRSNP